VICGGLQTQRDELLGDEESGLRPRWLPHIATMPEDGGTLGRSGAPAGWQLLIGGHLIPGRPTPRTWQLDKAAFAAFRDYREAYKAQARGVETGSTTAALGKADTHLARIALVLAEAQDPAAGGTIGTDTIERAAQIVDYTLDCWRSLPERGGLALSRRDEALDRGIPRLVAWLEEHGGEAIRTDLHRAHVAGCRTADELTALLARYEAIYPGRVVTETPEHGGTPTTTVRAPKRRAVSPVAIEVAVRNRNRTAKPNRGGYIDGIANGVATSPTTTSEAVSPEIGYTDLATPTKTPIPKPEKPLTHPGYTDTGYTDDAGGGDRAEAELRRATQKFGGGVV
jgi:hypothetical protein